MYRCKLTEREQQIKPIDVFGIGGVRVGEGCEDLANNKGWIRIIVWQLLVEAGRADDEEVS